MTAESIVYIVDADESLCEAASALLGTYGIEVQAFSQVEDFLPILHSGQAANCCLLLTDDPPEVDSSALLEQWTEHIDESSVIVLTGRDPEELRPRALAAGATAVMSKPLVAAYLLARLTEVLPGAASRLHTAPGSMELDNQMQVEFRLMQSTDTELEQNFFDGLSDRSRYLRFFSPLKTLPQHMLDNLTNTQFPLSYALLATVKDNAQERIIGVGRFAPTEKPDTAEFAVVAADEWQGHGLGSELLRGVTAAASIAGLNRLEGLVLSENKSMLALAKRMGFTAEADPEGDVSITHVSKNLRDPIQKH